MPEAHDAFDFRPLRREELPVVHRWMNAPHAVRWMGGESTLAEVTEEYLPAIDGEIPIHPYVVVHEGRAIGLVEWERLGDFPDLQAAYGVTDPDASNCDVIIGEADIAHRGLGPPMIRAFLQGVIFADPRITSCVIDPFIDNFIAIRAYEKAGFRFVRAAADDLEQGSVYLMEQRREELLVPREAAPYVRPARLEELPLAAEIDDDACRAYASVGLDITLPDDHPFVVAELARWTKAAKGGFVLFACSPEGEPVGFLALGQVDGRPHLQQISVRTSAMRRGIGRMLLDRARHWSVRPGELWLTTYDARVPWNEPWYTRAGFVRVPDAECGPELRAILEEERRALPSGADRIAMVYRHHPDRDGRVFSRPSANG